MKKLILFLLFCGLSSSFAAGSGKVQFNTKDHTVTLEDGSAILDAKAITLTLGGFTIYDGAGVKTITLGSSSGVKLGATGDKLGLLGATPIVRPSGNLFTALVNLGAVVSPSLTEGNVTNLTGDLLTLTNGLAGHIANVSNPHSVTKTHVGLGNNDNTSDAAKPVSTAQQTALNLKFDKTGGAISGPISLSSTISSTTSGIIPTGLVSDGTGDNTTAIQNALNAATLGTEVLIPSPGLYRCTGVLTIPQGVTLRGSRRGPSEPITIFPLVVNAAAFLITNTSSPFITVTGFDTGVLDLVFHYPNQVQPDATFSAPVTYPWTIYGDGNAVNCRVERCHFTNSYQGIYLQGGRHRITDCNIGGLATCIKSHNVADECFFSGNLFQEFYSIGFPDPNNLTDWVKAHGVGFELGQTAVNIVNSFSLNRHIGFLLNGTGSGIIVGGNFDSHDIFIQADNSDPNYGYTFSGVTAGSAPGSTSAVVANGTALVFIGLGSFVGWPVDHATGSGADNIRTWNVRGAVDNFAEDISGVTATLLANGEIATPFGSVQNFAGEFRVIDVSQGTYGSFFSVGDSMSLIGQWGGNYFSTTKDTSTHTNIYLNPTTHVVSVQNLMGGAHSYKFKVILRTGTQ